jgi:hypothetical protein
MTGATIVSRSGGLIEAQVDGELVGLHVDKGNCYGFNHTATRIWELLEQPKSVDALCDALVDEFDVDRPTCARDVMEVLHSLRDEGLVSFQEL